MISLALQNDVSIVGWGRNDSGQATPPGGNNYIAIAGGANHSVALRADGSLAAWGLNTSGQCNVPAGNNFVAIAAGYTHSVALKSDGSIVQWGNPPACGCVGSCPCYQTPPAGYDFAAIAAGDAHSLAVKSNGTLAGWGDETWGQLNLPGGNNWIAVAAGATHSVALRSTGSLWAEGGTGFYGQSDEPGGTVSSPIVERYSYDVYGKPTITAPNGSTRTTSNFGNRFMFTGREYDTETSNYYYRARYYSPKLGRFLQTDPVGYAEGLNLYTYCRNNPLNWIDPYGNARGFWNKTKEAIGGVRAVGPYDAYRSANGDIANGARASAGRIADRVAPNASKKHRTDLVNAARHAGWSARMAREFGPDKAERIGNLHELGEEGTIDSQKDQYNNNVGRGLGLKYKTDKDIDDAIEDMLRNQGLLVNDDDPRLGGKGEKSCGKDDSSSDSSSSDSSSSGDSTSGSGSSSGDSSSSS